MTMNCRACDSMEVLDQLVRTGIWSRPDSLFRFRRVVLDVESIVLSLYRSCMANHIRSQNSIRGKEHKLDLYAATLVNYTEFGRLVKRLLDYLEDHKIEPIMVYAGKSMEAPLFGLLAAEFTKNTQKVAESLNIVKDYDNKGPASYDSHDLKHGRQFGRPNLALIIFKSIVNIRRRAGAKIHVVQAFYSPYPQLAKMARDAHCPVITGNGDFIIMDVRAGFILFEDFWSQHIEQHNSQAKSRPKSVESRGGAKGRASSAATDKSDVSFHYNLLFLHQHPGLNAALAMNLYPLTTVDFVTKYGNSLQKLKVFDTGYKKTDFMASATGKGNAKQLFKKHHMAANRLEMVLAFLCSKSVSLMGNLIRGEATRTNTSFDDDFRNLFNYHAVAYEFKHRLRFALKHVVDPVQLNYIEWCLTNRECTADYLLDLLCCSIGRLACVSHNKSLQFEDLETRHSAYWLKNHAKSMLMSLFTANKTRKGEHSESQSSRQQDTETRYSTASLTIVDRQQALMAELNLTTTHDNTHLAALRPKLKLDTIAHGKVAKQDSVKFINLAFNSADITRLPAHLESQITKYLGKDEHSIRNELVIVRSLSIFGYLSSAADDTHLENTYAHLIHQFEVAIINHYLYINEALSKHKQANLIALVNLVNKLDLENLASDGLSIGSDTGSGILSSSGGKAPKSPKKHKKGGEKKSKSGSHVKGGASKQIRHLIEMLGAAIESYCELNAFFNYPLPRLNLYLHYNPILLYNLTLHFSHKALIKF